jgi:subtilisin family serine protease
MTRLRALALVLSALLGSLALLAAGGATAQTVQGAETPSPDPLVEVVVTLPQPPLAAAILRDRTLAAAATTTGRRLSLRAPAAVSYLRTLAAAQRRLQARIQRAIPDAQARWHYGVVANGIAVVVPRSQLGRLRAVDGATVWPSLRYHALLNKTPQLIGAPTVWGPTLTTTGNGLKIAVIDDGLDRTHPFFDPAGYAYPAGYPKGNTAYTTPKVIVARAFAPATPAWKYARMPFDPANSEHATNVAGIAAGNHDTLATFGSSKARVSGIAPGAYLGNYKVLTIPTENYGLDGNSPEIVAGIEAAVKDGMDVINLSLGEPEIEPSRDIVVEALNRAADAGVVPVVAAGNDYSSGGRGSIGSPATAAKAIAVAASSEGDSGPADIIAGFSSSGPTPVSLGMKPDLTAPGVGILSSLPNNQWSAHDWSGTSMAAPHVAGAAAVLKQRHPTWTPAQIKSALTSTGDPVHAFDGKTEVTSTREGGGRIDLPRADNPLLFFDPTGISFGFAKRGATVAREIAVSDAGGGPAPWTVTTVVQSAPAGATLAAPPVAVAGTALPVTLTVAPNGGDGESTGFVVLTRGTDVRRIPFWYRVATPQLGKEPHTALRGPGVYKGNTAKKQALVSTYRYAELGLAPAVPLDLSGPEQIFRLTLTKPVANFGVTVIGTGKRVRVSPRLVYAGDENRLVGYTGLPTNLNPYQNFGTTTPTVGAVRPEPGAYDFVFDTPTRGKPGTFTFRLWVNDTTPPTVRSLGHGRFAVNDAGSGVDPTSIKTTVDGQSAAHTYSRGIVSVKLGGTARSAHGVTVRVSDFQETKNMEDVGAILPNTRTLRVTVTR